MLSKNKTRDHVCKPVMYYSVCEFLSMFVSLRALLKKDDGKVTEGKKTRSTFTNSKNTACNCRLARIFETETDKVCTHTLRKLYAHMAFITHAHKDDDEFDHILNLLAHDDERVEAVLAYTCVRLDDQSPIK